ncbi:hypothetical protein llap_20174 [Limosa lapponica baueri]|uniref:Uncharacterized protein n=1 Tax=Limosa lapponica baueri TaxID=1758121 RepID=A0A2I0T6W9_LIMLA|nr:hypothetical protein llap_20174 [Limosa lapponica baueri]
MLLLQPKGSSEPTIDYPSDQRSWWHMEACSLPCTLGHAGSFKMAILAMPHDEFKGSPTAEHLNYQKGFCFLLDDPNSGMIRL